MQEPAATAWQPLTPRGVAAFGLAPPGRLLLLQVGFAVLAAAVLTWLLYTAWYPVIGQAVSRLPPEAQIRKARLSWPAGAPRVLAENRFLALVVDSRHSGAARSPAHLQVELGESDIRFFSLFGSSQITYPEGWVVGLNAQEAGPWWGAWAPVFLATAALGTVGGLLASWAVLASIYWLPVWLVGFYADRELGMRASWRIAAAAQLPGCLLLATAMLLYSFAALDLVQLSAAFGLHFVLSWMFLVWAPLSLPRRGAAPGLGPNPFAAPAELPARANANGPSGQTSGASAPESKAGVR